jgi:hypothetical protein
MAVDEQLDRLSRQLSKQSLGPVDTISNEMMYRLGSVIWAVVAWLRSVAHDRPLITLLLSCQVGYLVARIGRRHASR